MLIAATGWAGPAPAHPYYPESLLAKEDSFTNGGSDGEAASDSADIVEHLLRASDSKKGYYTANKESEVAEHLKMFARTSRISKSECIFQ